MEGGKPGNVGKHGKGGKPRFQQPKVKVDDLSDQGWFEVQRFPHTITMIREPHHSEDVKSYLIEGERDVAVIDAGLGVADFAALVADLSSLHPRLLQTHAHWDHIGASHRFDDVLVHPSEAAALRSGVTPGRFHDVFWRDSFDHSQVPAGFDTSSGMPGVDPTGPLEDGDRIELGGRELEVLHTPGHSPGGVSFLDRQGRALFCGDLLYLGRMYVFFANSDPAAFRESLRRVTDLISEMDAIYPSHGSSPLSPEDVLTIRAAYEEVWDGRPFDRTGSLYGYPIATYDFGGFSFLLPPDGPHGITKG